jgi:DNA-binding transcriptional LysR family regulator
MHLTTNGVSPADMLLFNDVVQHGGFTAAARQHGISKQSVSERISRLEQVLGVRLLQRTTRSLKPTEAGARYQAHCQQIAALIAQANAAMQAEQAEPTGTLNVSAPRVFGRGGLIGLLKVYRQRHPKVHVNVRLTDQLLPLVDEQVDVALRVSSMDDSSLSVRRLGTARAFFAASPRLMRQLKPRNDMELIRTGPVLSLRPGEVWELPDGLKFRPRPVMTIDDLTALSVAVDEGVGIARLPGLLCRPLLAKQRIRLLLDGAPAASFTVFAAYVSKKQLSPKVRSFIDLLVERRDDFTDGD